MNRIFRAGRLHQSLLQNYTGLGEPLFNRSVPMEIGVDLEVYNVKDIDMMKSEVTVAAWARVRWQDDQLTWNPVRGVRIFFKHLHV